MRRRRCLALLSASIAGAAGCLSDDPTDPTNDASGGTDPTDEPTDTTDPTGAPDATPGDDPAGFPPDDDGVDEVVWAGDVDDPSGRVALAADVASTTLPDAQATFTLHNRSDRQFASNFYDWGVYRREGGRWHRVAPLYVNQPLMYLEAGASHAWTVELSSEIPTEQGLHAGGTDDVAVSPLGGGEYAFAVDGWFPDQTATPTHEHKTVHAARFDLDGPELSLEPSNAVRSADRDGDVVRIEADGEPDEGREATYVLRRAPEATAPVPLTTEEAYRRWPLRDALAHAGEGVAEIRLRAPDGTHPPFGVHADDPMAYAYEGTTWLETVEAVADE
jgi:hypothetical protein